MNANDVKDGDGGLRAYLIKQLLRGDSGDVELERALVVATDMESAARKWAKAFSLSPEGKERVDVVCVARSSAGTPWAHFKIMNKSMKDSDVVYFGNDLYSITEHRRILFADDTLLREASQESMSNNEEFATQNSVKDSGIDTWTGMRVFELLNIPGLTCHEGAWQALSDEQRARCESIARAINRDSAPRSGLSTGEPAPINRDFAATKEDPVPGSDESKQNIPDRFDAAGFEWLQNEILNDLQRRVDTSPELEMKQAFQRAGFDVVRTFSSMRRAIHLAALSSIRVPNGSAPTEAPQESAVKPLPIQYPDNLS